MLILIPITCVFITCVAAQTVQDGLKVNTTEGPVVGVKATDGDYTAFYGIPYAGSVSGEFRYKAPRKPELRNADFEARDANILCAQPTIHGLAGVEDCLTLNIFTKNFTTPKPVLVWLAGEEYSNTNDTPRYSFRSLVEADIVVVAVNYRLSIFGFLCLGVEEAPGNAGLKDVVRALEWIKDNVVGFGGNPANVMLFGHGSGAAMVDLLTLSLAQAQGLVHKAVAISGSAFSPYAVAYDPIGYARALGAKLGYTHKNNSELAKHFQKAAINVLVTEINNFTFTNNSVLFAPCVENTQLVGSLLVDDPSNIIKAGKHLQIPFIAGYVDVEGTIRAEQAVHGNWLKMMSDDFVPFLPANLAFKDNTTQKNAAKKLRESYFGSKKELDNENINDFLAYEGDSLITIPVIRGVRERAKVNSEVWMLEFTYEDENYDWPYPTIRLNGVQHGAILSYIFDLDKPVKRSDKPKNALTNRLVTFANTGKPEGDILWPPYTCLAIGGYNGSSDRLKEFFENPVSKPHDQYVNFWENSLSKYYAIASAVASEDSPNTTSTPLEPTGEETSNLGLILGLLAAFIILTGVSIFGCKRYNVLDKIRSQPRFSRVFSAITQRTSREQEPM
ncbi:venom carboxylesterase-6-like [Ostrinia nubilalis]|uniref:venom carboxylesterase-6-like n=1 Tax=Ostrinia nubilalis TaxID=29057 RepID=UPI00308238CD